MITRDEATDKVERFFESKLMSKTEMAKFLNMSRPTLYKRIEFKNWRMIEIQKIHALNFSL